MANIDRADWHYGGNYPADLPRENAGTHIGMFLAWVVARNLASKCLIDHAGTMLQKLHEREITGRTLLFEAFDEKFFDGLLTRRGKQFVRDYYESNAYIADYDEALGGELPTTYHIADTWENYDKLAAVLNERFARWEKGELPPAPPKDPALAAHEEAQARYMALIVEASKHLATDPDRTVRMLEEFIANDPYEGFKTAAATELSRVRIKYGKNAT